jgi:hypothetical protein
MRTGYIGRRGRTNRSVGTNATTVWVHTATASTSALVCCAAVWVHTATASTSALVCCAAVSTVSPGRLRQVGKTLTQRKDRDRRRRSVSHSGPRSHGQWRSEERRRERYTGCVRHRQFPKTGGRDERLSIGDANRYAHSYAGTDADASADRDARAHTNAKANTYTHVGTYPHTRVVRDLD